MARTPFDRRAIPPGASFSTWTAPDGWICRRLDWPSEQSGRGAMIFAGGRGDFIEKHFEAIAYWRSRGWNVTAFDWRGQGGSRGTILRGHYDDFDPLVADLAALIADTKKAAPASPLVAIAHSMGGHVLLRILAERAPALDAAVLVAPMVQVNSAPIPAKAASAIASLMVALGLGRLPVWRARTPPPAVGSRRQTYLTGSRDRYEDETWWWEREPGFNLGAPSWGWLKAAYASSRRLGRDSLASVRIPVLLLGAEHDRLVSAAAIREAAAALPDSELAMFADSGHEILREADPVRERAMARIDSFLDARAPR
jgi:lysophospholipase